jgi:prenylcysteine oxidase/farnesylcysteine lyase
MLTAPGAGAGGSSTAYHLAQYATKASIPAAITVFERNTYVGGRTTTVDVWDNPSFPVELGGSIFVEVNHIMVEAMKRFRLSPASTAALDMPDLGIWNGEEFVLVTRQEDGWWDKARLLWRYGTAPLWTNRLMKASVGKFLSMYDEPVFPWRSLSDVVEKVGLLEATGVTGEQYLKANGVGEAFSREIIQARYVVGVLSWW